MFPPPIPAHVLVFDIETVGQTRRNPNVSIGAALVDANGQIAITDGQPSIFEVFLPWEQKQILDPRVVKDFWEREANRKQFAQWMDFNDAEKGHRPSLTEQVRRFVDWCDHVTQNRRVEIFVDTAMFDVCRLNMLLEESDPWPGKPESWGYLLRNRHGERYYSEIQDIKSFYYAWSHLPLDQRQIARRLLGGIKAHLYRVYNIPRLICPYNNDHYASHDAAYSAMHFVHIRKYCEWPIHHTTPPAMFAPPPS